MSVERPAAVVVLVVDRLHAGYLGSYGNAWVETPELDRLAAESTVFDAAFVARPTLESLYPHALWLGRHPLESLPAGVDEKAWAEAGGQWGDAAGGWEPLPATLQRSGVETILVSDDAYVSRIGERYFGEVVRVAPPEDAPTIRTDVLETRLAGFFAEAFETLQAWQQESSWRPFFLWLHTKGLAPPWDAPLSFRRPFVEDDDEKLPDVCDFNDFTLADNFDPDERLIYQRSYAAQVAAFDECISPLLDVIREAPPERPTVFLLVGARGLALGERRRVGLWDSYLHEEIVHTPLLIRGVGGDSIARRSLAMTSSLDVPATLLDLYGLPATTLARTGRSLLPLARGDAEATRERLLLVGDREYAVRTPAWHLQQPRAMLETVEEDPAKPFDMADARGCQLFAKPDDRWEVNDVSGRAQHIVEKLLPLAAELKSALQTGDENPPALDESLRSVE